MLARFGGPLYVTDDYIPGIYTEIFNILILSVSPSEVQRQLLQLCSRKGHQNPYNYFKWGFSGVLFLAAATIIILFKGVLCIQTSDDNDLFPD